MARITVTTLVDENDGGNGGTGLSLREAIALANASAGKDRIIFDSSLKHGTISLSLDEALRITDDVTISGLGANNLTLDANQQSQLFIVDDGTDQTIDVVLKGLTLTGGQTSGAGGAILNAEKLKIQNSVITGNTAESGGGGIANQGGELTVLKSQISENSTGNGDIEDASDVGGGILNTDNGHVSVFKSQISDNQAESRGGGIYSTSGRVSIQQSTISGNEAQERSGGGISNLGVLNVNNSVLADNTANSGGGGIANAGDSQITNSTLSNNAAMDDYSGGGGFLNTNGGVATIHNSQITDNTSTYSGGGITNTDESTLSVRDSQIANNTAQYGNGGGVENYSDSDATITNSVISGNTAGLEGGGIYNTYSTLTLNDSTVQENSVGNAGGGIANAGDATVNKSVIIGNTAAQGGGIANGYDSAYYSLPGYLTVRDSIIAANMASDGGGGVANILGSATVSGTAIVSNSSPTGDLLGPVPFESDGDNVIGDGSGAEGFVDGVKNDIVGIEEAPSAIKVGTDNSDTLNGTLAIGDLLAGLDNDDTLRGKTGGDLLLGGDGDDFIHAGSDNDIILGQAGNDELKGFKGDDVIRGGTGNDEIEGGSGADSLRGGQDRGRFSNQLEITIGDVLRGGQDGDRFFYSNGDGVDQITDFNLSEDELIIQGLSSSVVEYIDAPGQVGTIVAFRTGGRLQAHSAILIDGISASDFSTTAIVTFA